MNKTVLDFTPTIYYCDISSVIIKEHILERFDEPRLNRIKKCIKPQKAKHLYSSSMLLNFVLDKLGSSTKTVLFNEDGKPYLTNDVYFNISHSGKYVVIAVSPFGEIGVDVQEKEEISVEKANFFLGENAMNNITPQINYFYSYIWCRKEAFLKCLGTGWNLKETSDISVLKTKFVFQDNTFCLSDYSIDENYCLSLCQMNTENEFQLKEVLLNELEVFNTRD